MNNTIKKNLVKVGVVGVILAPLVSFAQVKNLKWLIDLAIEYLGYIIPLIISLSIVVFIWGIYKYFFKVDADKKEAGQLVLYGIIGFFVMISFWGLVNILKETFNLNNTPAGIPTIGSGTGSNPFGVSSGGAGGNNNGAGNPGAGGNNNIPDGSTGSYPEGN